MFLKYRQFIEHYISHNFIEWNLFKSKLTIEKFKKGETILHIGDTCDALRFMNRGLARAYMINEEGKDYTWSIFFNDKNSHMVNLYVVDYDSFLNQTEATLNIEALEDCEFITITYKDVQYLYDTLKKGERFGRIMSQEAYSYLHKQTIDRQSKTAEERFNDFIQKTPYLLDKVPQYYIASLLDITPQYFSQLKQRYQN
jgi:CRP-like cAMP-binding protein